MSTLRWCYSIIEFKHTTRICICRQQEIIVVGIVYYYTRASIGLPSWLKMQVSRLPELKKGPPFQARLPTLAVCPFIVLILERDVESHSWTSPFCKPIPMCFPSGPQLKLVTGPSSWLTCINSLIAPEAACHKYTVFPSAIATTFFELQSNRFK